MATFNINVDTQAKTVDVTIDGNKVDNVNDVHVYAYDEGYSIEVCTVSKSGDIRNVTRMYASGAEKFAEKELDVKEELINFAKASLNL